MHYNRMTRVLLMTLRANRNLALFAVLNYLVRFKASWAQAQRCTLDLFLEVSLCLIDDLRLLHFIITTDG